MESKPEDVSRECLTGLKVIEDVCQDTPELVRQAIGFAGRLAVDAGASVYAAISPIDAEWNVYKEFLYAGKLPLHDAPVSAIRITDKKGEIESGVYVSLLPRTAGDNTVPQSDLTLQARTGICHLIGDPERYPLKLGGNQSAAAAGYAIFTALMGVVMTSERFGKSDVIDVDLHSVLTWINWKAIAFGSLGKELVREGDEAEWPVFKTRDGYAAMVFFEPQWETVCTLIGDTRLRDARLRTFEGRERYRGLYQGVISEWFATLTKLEVSRILDENGIPNGVVATPLDLLTDRLIEHRGGLLDFELIKGGRGKRPHHPMRVYSDKNIDSEARCSNSWQKRDVVSTLPLAGLKVLDMGIITAGAGAGALLADLGADVIKVESISYPDPFRKWAGSSDEDSPLFRFNNRNKRGICLDLKTQSGRTEFLKLVGESDVVLENFRRGVMERLLVDFNSLVDANPNVILLSLTGQGLSGPGTGNVSFGSSLEARSGISSITGYPGEVPRISGRNLNYPDQIVCLYAAGVVMSALRYQQRHPGPLHVDISQRDVAIFTLSSHIVSASMGDDQQLTTGNTQPEYAFQQILKTKDGSYLAVTITKNQATLVMDALKLDSLTDLPCWVAERSTDFLLELFIDLDIACGPSLGGAQVFADPARCQGSAFSTSPSGELVKGFPFQFRSEPMRIYRDSPAIGEHNSEIIDRD